MTLIDKEEYGALLIGNAVGDFVEDSRTHGGPVQDLACSPAFLGKGAQGLFL
jgi:hypothetical protein